MVRTPRRASAALLAARQPGWGAAGQRRAAPCARRRSEAPRPVLAGAQPAVGVPGACRGNGAGGSPCRPASRPSRLEHSSGSTHDSGGRGPVRVGRKSPTVTVDFLPSDSLGAHPCCLRLPPYFLWLPPLLPPSLRPSVRPPVRPSLAPSLRPSLLPPPSHPPSLPPSHPPTLSPSPSLPPSCCLPSLPLSESSSPSRSLPIHPAAQAAGPGGADAGPALAGSDLARACPVPSAQERPAGRPAGTRPFPHVPAASWRMPPPWRGQ